MKRREFFIRVGAIVTTMPALAALNACGGDDGDDNGNGNGPDAAVEPGDCTQGVDVSIGSNHGHEIQVSPAEVADGGQKSYTIQGSSDHSHEVVVTEADFAMLQQGTAVTVVSSVVGHSHRVTIRCAAA